MKHVIPIVMILSLLFCSTTMAVTLRVPSNFPTIQQACSTAEYGDTVEIAAGTYNEYNITVGFGITVTGATGDPADVIIDPSGLGRAFTCNSVNYSRIEALTIGGGDATQCSDAFEGGAIYIVDSRGFEIVNCVIDGNNASFGGGVSVSGNSEVTLTDCIVRNNTSDYTGGGLKVDGGATVDGLRTFFDTNESMYGGAVFAANAGDADYRLCTFADNVADNGGGFYVDRTDLAFDESRVVNNTANTAGGGLYVQSADVTGFDSYILDNTVVVKAAGDDGVLLNDFGSCSASFTCGKIIFSGWDYGDRGPVSLSSDGTCPVGSVESTWGAVRTMYR